MSEQPNFLLASKAFGASRRGPILVDGMAADKELRRDFRRLMAIGFLLVLFIGVPTVTAYALRVQINHFFASKGIKIEIFVPRDGRSLRR